MASDNTESRRERVRSLWIKPDRRVAEILIDEGFAGPVPTTADGKRKQLASMTKNVWNDRKWWRQAWRAAKRLTNEDLCETRGEYIATLDAIGAAVTEILEDPKIKGTPRVQAASEFRQVQQAKAKASGVAEPAPATDAADTGMKPVVIGVVLGTGNVSAETRDELRQQGIEIDSNDDSSEGCGPAAAPEV